MSQSRASNIDIITISFYLYIPNKVSVSIDKFCSPSWTQANIFTPLISFIIRKLSSSTKLPS